MTPGELTLFLCGDVMTGRGVDQILRHAGDPTLREPAVTDARNYVRLAERANGPIPAPVDDAWPWGDALAVLDDVAPDVRILNLETAVTADGDFAQDKAVHYRMHPDNLGCLTAVRPDVCALANNHVLDFGPTGLADTLRALTAAGIAPVGAGLNAHDAKEPAVLGLTDNTRIVIAAAAMTSSGVPRDWAATASRPGVVVADLSERGAVELADGVVALKRPGDIGVVSLHWGSNWGYGVEADQVRFAHRLIDAGVDVVHGHSSHHPRPVEVYRGKLILYGCGDTVDDYEGIGGYEPYRDELRLLYFATIDRGSGVLTALRLVPMRARRMRLELASPDDAEWLRRTLEDASQRFGTRFHGKADGTLAAGPA
ncbi:putative polyglutamine synthesis accessory protein [Mycobacterium sp. MFM001]|uniref:CapA family protein n=1 Tax=Mycobacterium sp. MFM001 TaxID=2049453 RepID=UPI000DA57F01|nr:CapA family protein [Mycobacterium sp. MFM001]GBE66842.1 putative polyglutamine synthesis accessory protein [Mycobacterium sp. MFM001]